MSLSPKLLTPPQRVIAALFAIGSVFTIVMAAVALRDWSQKLFLVGSALICLAFALNPASYTRESTQSRFRMAPAICRVLWVAALVAYGIGAIFFFTRYAP